MSPALPVISGKASVRGGNMKATDSVPRIRESLNKLTDSNSIPELLSEEGTNPYRKGATNDTGNYEAKHIPVIHDR